MIDYMQINVVTLCGHFMQQMPSNTCVAWPKMTPDYSLYFLNLSTISRLIVVESHL